MKRIIDITNTKHITLENLKVSFQIKLLQYNINNILFNYNNKYALQIYIDNLKKELVDTINKSNLKNDTDAKELLDKIRNIYISLNTYDISPTINDINLAVDNTIKYILFNYTKNKYTYTLNQLVELLQELKYIKSTIEEYKLDTTDRINNLYKLIEQVKTIIINSL
jgi:hypothetical protein